MDDDKKKRSLILALYYQIDKMRWIRRASKVHVAPKNGAATAHSFYVGCPYIL